MATLIALGNQLPRHVLDDRQCFREVLVAVSQRESGVTWRALPRVPMEVHPALDAASGEAPVQFVIVPQRISPGAYWLGDAEVDAKTRPHALDAGGNASAVEDVLHVAVESIASGVDPFEDSRLGQFVQRR